MYFVFCDKEDFLELKDYINIFFLFVIICLKVILLEVWMFVFKDLFIGYFK